MNSTRGIRGIHSAFHHPVVTHDNEEPVLKPISVKQLLQGEDEEPTESESESASNGYSIMIAKDIVTGMSRQASSSKMTEFQVYVHSEEYGWIPGRIVETSGSNATVVVQDYKNDQDIIFNMQNVEANGVNFRKLAVNLKEYENNVLPLQNVDDSGCFQEYDDMVDMPYPHEAAILYNLTNRHSNCLPYTRSGDIIVAMNPYKWYNELYTEKLRAHYGDKLVWEESKDDPRQSLKPHVYEVSSLSFKGLLHDDENQSILVSGESGAGKTETVKICMNHIANIQAKAHKAMSAEQELVPSNIVQKVLDSNFMLEAFGNSKTRRNNNSSRFGKYTQLQFDVKKTTYKGKVNTQATLAGSMCEVYLLEKNRVVSHDYEERTFHIFYQLLAADEEEKTNIWEGLTDATNETFAYVGSTQTHTIEDMHDSKRYELTRESLELLGIEDEKYSTLMRALCIVLQLGNIRFVADSSDDDISKVSTPGELGWLSDLMGISIPELTKCFTERTMKAGVDVYKVPLNERIAKESCDAFAKEIYGRLFLWLVNSINKATCAEENFESNGSFKASDDYMTIGLLDIFGFESFDHNRFEQLCINYANEKIQQKFTEDIFKSVQQEYLEEGIPMEDIRYDDNTHVLDLIEGRQGLVKILNDECYRPKGNAEAFVQKAFQQMKDSPILIKDNMDRCRFGIQHFAGEVMYDAEEFLTRNLDTFPADLLECATKCTNNSVVSFVFSNQFTDPSLTTTNNSAARRKSSGIMGTTVWTKYKGQLSDLMTNLRQTSTRYIRCIKPNNTKEPVLAEHKIVMEQLRSAGLVAGVKIARSAFPNRLDNKIVYATYSSVWDRKNYPSIESDDPGGKLKHDCLALLTCAFKGKDTVEDNRVIWPFVVGKTTTYFRSGALEYLEFKRLESFSVQATFLQKHIRGYFTRKHNKYVIEACKLAVFKVLELQRLRAFTGQAISIQKCFRGWIAREDNQHIIRAVKKEMERQREHKRLLGLLAEIVLVQSIVRGWLTRKHNQYITKAVEQARIRFRVLMYYRNFNAELILIQKRFRGWLARKKNYYVLDLVHEELTRQKRLAKEENARIMLIEKAAEERRKVREGYHETLRSTIQHLEEQCAEVDAERHEAISMKKESMERRNTMTIEYDEKIRQLRETTARNKLIVKENNASIEGNKEIIFHLQTQNKKLSKDNKRVSKMHKRVSETMEKILENSALVSAELEDADPDQLNDIHEDLKNELEMLEIRNQDLKSGVDDWQKKYLKRASERVQCQRAMNQIWKALKSRCHHVKLVRKIDKMISKIELETKNRLGEVKIDFGYDKKHVDNNKKELKKMTSSGDYSSSESSDSDSDDSSVSSSESSSDSSDSDSDDSDSSNSDSDSD